MKKASRSIDRRGLLSKLVLKIEAAERFNHSVSKLCTLVDD